MAHEDTTPAGVIDDVLRFDLANISEQLDVAKRTVADLTQRNERQAQKIISLQEEIGALREQLGKPNGFALAQLAQAGLHVHSKTYLDIIESKARAYEDLVGRVAIGDGDVPIYVRAAALSILVTVGEIRRLLSSEVSQREARLDAIDALARVIRGEDPSPRQEITIVGTVS